MKLNLIKWTAALFFVLILIIATNLIDKRNFHQVAYSLETIYEDRLVAKDLIFEISLLMHEKSMALANSDSTFYNQRILKVNEKIDQLIKLYSETKLTQEERMAFERFQSDIAKLNRFEVGVTAVGDSREKYLKGQSAPVQMEKILEDLHVLSKIQIEEGKRQMLIGKAAVNSIDFFTQLEIYILIVIGILIQIILISGFRFQKIRQRGNSGNWLNN
ncbi:MAG: MCP four helix bundle domain-containing protein [Flavobacteriales bacterium]